MSTEFNLSYFDKVRMFTRMAESAQESVADLLLPWVRDNPEAAADVMAMLAALADEEKILRWGHSAYSRGDRGEEIVALEREYQRKRKANNRVYQLHRDGLHEEDAS